MTRDEAIQIGFPVEWLPSDLSVAESKRNTCDDCGVLIEEHPDARWRLRLSPCRCESCANKIIARGETVYEAYYVT